MANRLVKQSKSEYVPAVVPVVAQPARCVTTSSGGNAAQVAEALAYNASLASRFASGNVTSSSASRAPGATSQASGVQSLVSATTAAYYLSLGLPIPPPPPPRPRDVPALEPPRVVTVCYPEVVGVPGRDAVVNTYPNLGWNAGAKSIASLVGDGTLSFVISPSSAGVLCGLAPAWAETGVFNAVSHGFLYVGGTLRLVEYGTTILDTGLAPGASQALHVTRRGTTVTYRVGDWTRTSPSPSRGSATMVAVLYAAGDAVDNPRITRQSSIQARSSWGWRDASTPAEPIRSSWRWGGRATMGDGAIRFSFDVDVAGAGAGAGEAYGSLTGEVADLVLVAESGAPTPEVVGIYPSFEVTVSGIGYSGYSGRIDTIVELEAWGSEEDQGALVGEVADVVGYGYDTGEAPNAGSHTTYLYAQDAYFSDPILYAAIRESLRVGSTFDALLLMDARLAEYLTALDQTDPSAVFQALLRSGIRLADNASQVRAGLLQYATNLLTGAVTRYEGFDFGGFCRSGLRTYGWKADGVYKIGAPTDDGELISAMVELGADDFGTLERKRLSTIFFGLSTDGQMFAKLTDDNGRTTTYRISSRVQGVGRTNPAQGPSSRFWRLQLEVLEATYAELDNIEWVAGATGRRTTR